VEIMIAATLRRRNRLENLGMMRELVGNGRAVMRAYVCIWHSISEKAVRPDDMILDT
jgi:hypothetical protein